MLTPLLLWLLPQVVLPSPGQLEAARNNHDEVELARLGCRLGAVRLLRLAAQAATSPQRVAALEALGLCGAHQDEVAVQALWPLAELLGRSEELPLLQAGARAAVRLGRRLGRAMLQGEERYDDELPRAAALLLQLARERPWPPELRAELVEAATSLPRPLWSIAALVPLAHAERPVQQAALSALAQAAPQGGAAALEQLAAEQDPAVAVPAVAMLCETAPSGPAAERARQLAAPRASTSPELRLLLRACLQRLGTPLDRSLLRTLGGGRRARP
ncbi:MAG: hypothetical protein RMK29_05800 [Myxococcales bacterium]|nr:hypothetical protein [Myxococcales bacterium]